MSEYQESPTASFLTSLNEKQICMDSWAYYSEHGPALHLRTLSDNQTELTKQSSKNQLLNGLESIQ